MAGQALKIIANSSQINHLVDDKHMFRLVSIFKYEEMEVRSRVAIADTFIMVAKIKALRKSFF